MHIDSPTHPRQNAPPAFVVRLVLRLHSLVSALARRLLPPEAVAFDTAIGGAKAFALRAAIRVGIFDLLAEKPHLSSGEVASALGLNPDATHRLLRALATLDLVRVSREGRFHNSTIGASCRKETGVSSFVEYFCSPSNLASWAEIEQTLATGHSAFDFVHGRSVWRWFDEHERELATFTEAMSFLTLSDASAIASGYPFAARRSLCDVGGGRGTLAGEILVRYSELHVTIVDRPAVLPHAAQHLTERGVRDRATLVPGDFFRDIPAGHDTYLLKNILHDWDDNRCIEILKNVRSVCAAGTVLIVVEEQQERLALGPTALGDLQMMVVCDGGRERSIEEFRALFAAAGFAFVAAHQTGSLMVLFEGLAT